MKHFHAQVLSMNFQLLMEAKMLKCKIVLTLKLSDTVTIYLAIKC